MFERLRICRALLAVLAFCLLATATGCSCSPTVDANPRKPVFRVTGELFYNGEPAKHVIVLLQPVDEAVRAEVWPQGFPKANVAPDGKFEIGTYEAADGAPAGEYFILVIPTSGALGEAPVGDSVKPVAKSGPGNQFSSPERPAGRCVVETKENNIPRLLLTGA